MSSKPDETIRASSSICSLVASGPTAFCMSSLVATPLRLWSKCSLVGSIEVENNGLEFQLDAKLLADYLRPMLKTVKAGDGDGFFVEHLSYVLGQAVERGGVAGERCLDCGQPAGQLVYAILSGETLDGLIKMFFGEFHGRRINGEGSIANGANPSRTRPCSCFSAARPRQPASGRRGRCGSSPGLCPGWLSEFARWPRLRRIRPSSGAFGFFSGGPLKKPNAPD